MVKYFYIEKLLLCNVTMICLYRTYTTWNDHCQETEFILICCNTTLSSTCTPTENNTSSYCYNKRILSSSFNIDKKYWRVSSLKRRRKTFTFCRIEHIIFMLFTGKALLRYPLLNIFNKNAHKYLKNDMPWSCRCSNIKIMLRKYFPKR